MNIRAKILNKMLAIQIQQYIIELINEFGKVAGYKIHRNLLHFYMLTMKDQKEKFKKQSHLPLHQKE